jgi:hypothetical protein
MPVSTTTEGARAATENATARRARLQAEAAAAKRADVTTPIGGVVTEELPEPPSAQSTPARPTRPATLAEAAPWLLRPFPQSVVELKPTATTGDKSRALASPYVDMRAYYSRLDKIVGAEHWSSVLTLSERGAVCSLTIFGVTKAATGDYPIDPRDENPVTSAESQAFKRACSAFGLGRYLYSLPQVWGAYDEKKKQLIDPAGIVAQMYASLPRGDE